MKEYIKKFKHWLIRKLGGVPEEWRVNVVFEQPAIEVEQIVSETFIPNEAYGTIPSEVYHRKVIEKLMGSLGHYIVFETSEDFMSRCKVLRGTIAVVNPKHWRR
jgi:hypothetical protein